MIAAEGEHKASRALKEAAEVIVDSPAALQLRWVAGDWSGLFLDQYISIFMKLFTIIEVILISDVQTCAALQ